MKNCMVRARAYKNWTLEDWGTVVWSDESRFVVSIGDSRSRVIRTFIMVWGSMSSSSVGRLYFADGTINANKYIEILKWHLLPTIESLELDSRKRVFQQDGAPCHSARKIKVWMTENNLETLPWVSSSPDLSSIETLWNRMKKKLREHPARTLNDLKRRLQKIWDSFVPDECKALVDTMPSRIEAVLKHKGSATQW
ncbi:hypothetical protein ILUMI_20855 [Ignelater luminosus]|uniref:Tc1-like transposase DDE domain-containing protein n=1 Tax=Ignelater luminosus TaxID=2038154 RepID=A0A8K0CDK5_IGNLU|nr:hypothetical protein ILUMI_20855 [Ignelater luminosus]